MKIKSLFILALYGFSLLNPINTHSQDHYSEEAEFILLELDIQRTLVFDYEGLLQDENLFIPILLLLQYSEIPYSYNDSQQKLQINYYGAEREITIDFIAGNIEGHRLLTNIMQDQFIVYNRAIYVNSEFAESVLDISLNFDYRNLKLYLDTDRKLPAVKNYERQKKYESLSHLNTNIQVEKTIRPQFHILKGWFADWAVSSSHSFSDYDYGYSLGLGGHVLGGAFQLNSRGSRQYRFNWNDTRWNWQLPIYGTELASQIISGDQNHEDVLGGGYLNYQGINITNKPKSPRRNFDTKYLNRLISAGWDVEFYTNNQLAQIARVNEQKHVRFEMPLKYGSNTYKFHYFDKHGLEKIESVYILIPSFILPKGEIEYNLAAGRYRTIERQMFSRGDVSWGLSSYITLGGGIHYIAETKTFIPYAQTWFRVGSNLMLQASHANNYFSSGMLNYTFKNMSPLQLSYKHYHKSSPYNRINKKSEATFNTSIPIVFFNNKISTYVSANYSEYQNNDYLSIYSGLYTQLPLHFSLRINNNLGYYNLKGKAESPSPAVKRTELQISKQLLRKFLIRPFIQFDYMENHISAAGIEINSSIFNDGNITLQYNRNFFTGHNNIMLRFTINFDGARHSSQINISRTQPSLFQSTGGAIAFNSGNIHTDNRSWIGKSALKIEPFLDYNTNQEREKNEPLISELEMNIYEGTNSKYPVKRNKSIVSHLTPYEDYIVSIDNVSLDNPLWSPTYSHYKMTVLPNMVNVLSVPIQVNGEIEGQVKLKNTSFESISGLKIYIKNEKDEIVDSTYTYSDGNYFIVGLHPGTYVAVLDSNSLKQNNLEPVQARINFEIRANKRGDIVTNLNFDVVHDSTAHESLVEEPKPDYDLLDRNSANMELETIPQQNLETEVIRNNKYTIQVGAFRNLKYASAFSQLVQKHTEIDSFYAYDEKRGLYICQIGKYENKWVAWDAYFELLSFYEHLFEYAYVIPIIN